MANGGKSKVNESDRSTALREFQEETTIQLNRTADNLVQFDDQYQRECDQSTESGLGFVQP